MDTPQKCASGEKERIAVTFSQMNEEQLRSYLDTEVIPLLGGEERERNRREYGPLYGGWLNELMAILELQERQRLLVSETQDLARTAFCKYVAKHAPEIEKQAIRYRAQAAAEAAEAARIRGEQVQRQADRRVAEEKARADRKEAEEIERDRANRARQAEMLVEFEATRAREDAVFVQRTWQ